MSLTPCPLVSTIKPIFHCVFVIPLVVLVVWSLVFLYVHHLSPKCNIFAFDVFVSIGVKFKGIRLIEMFGSQIPCFLSNSKILFISIVMVWLCLICSYCCHFTKNVIYNPPLGSICRPSDSGSGCTENTVFIKCVDGREPHIHGFWCLGMDMISYKVHTTLRV